MGYTTDFTGRFQLNKHLTAVQSRYLHKFNQTRRMTLDVAKVEALPDPIRDAVGLPVGQDGEYFVGFPDNDPNGDKVPSTDHNKPPSSQPGLWCGWCPTSDLQGIEWDGGEKFYYYVEWLEYLIVNFIKPWGLIMSGQVKWQGESRDDHGSIRIDNNSIEIYASKLNMVDSSSDSDCGCHSESDSENVCVCHSASDSGSDSQNHEL